MGKAQTVPCRCCGYSNHHCERYLAECRELLQAAGILQTAAERPLNRQETAESAEQDESSSAEATTRCCAGCGALLVCIAADARVSWFSVMHSPHRPSWYNDGSLPDLPTALKV